MLPRSLTLTLAVCGALTPGCSNAPPAPTSDMTRGDQSRLADVPVAGEPGRNDLRPPDSARADQGRADAGKPPCQEVPCAVSKTVNSQAALLAELDLVPWAALGPYTSKCLPVTADIEVSGGPFTIDGSSVKLPPNCSAASTCRTEVRFQKNNLPAGVTCVKDDSETWTSLCSTLSFTAGRYRFRGEVQDWHPSKWNFMPVMVVLPSCLVPCGAGQLLCEPNHTCWGGFASYCKLCLARGNQECPCLTATGAKPDKTPCSFAVSGDVMCQGECQAGFCKYTGTPGWAGCP